MRPTDLAYAAGFLDGEGCFRFSNGTAHVRIENTYPKTLEWFAELFGGNVRARKRTSTKWRQAYIWEVFGSNACRLIALVYPYLQEKQEQAIILLEVYRYPPRSAMREALMNELCALKRIDSLCSPLITSQPQS